MHDGVLRLARENAHPRDARIAFDEAKHQYTVDGHVVIGSVSSLWGSRFETFEAEKTARRCYGGKWSRAAREGADADAWTYTERYVRLVEGGSREDAIRAGVPSDWWSSTSIASRDPAERGYARLLAHMWSRGLDKDACVDGVVTLWSRLGEVASERGTYVHLQCELHCNDEAHDEDAVEVRQYHDFRADHPHLVPYRTEWSVFARLGLYVVSGQVDALYRDARDGTFHMIDYKCCAHELTSSNPYGKVGLAPFDEIPDNPWGHYACQQNIYRHVLERHYGIPLASARLLRVHSTIDAYELVSVPDLRANVASLFRELERVTRVPNIKSSPIQRVRRKFRILTHVLRLSIYSRRKKKMSDAPSPSPSSESPQILTQKKKTPTTKKKTRDLDDDAKKKKTKKVKRVASPAPPTDDDDESKDDRSIDADADADVDDKSVGSDDSRGDADADEVEEETRESPYAWWRPEYDVLADKIMAEGGFPTKAGNFFLHQGIGILNEGALKVASKLGGPVESSTLIKETNSFYLQPRHDDQSVYAVLFGVANERNDSTRFNEFRSTIKVRLDNVTQSDVVQFQGLPRWVFDRNKTDDPFEEFTSEQIYDSVKSSTAYKMLVSSFCLPLATQVSKSKLNKDHVAKGEDHPDGRYLDKYVRERLGKIDQDAPYDAHATDFTWLKDKTKLGLPLTKDEITGEWRTYVGDENTEASAQRKPTFEVELPIRPDEVSGSGKFDVKGRGPKVTRVDGDGKKSRATAEDIVRDFPLREPSGGGGGGPGGGGSSAPNKMLMLFVQYDTLQNGKFAGPGLRCNVKEMVYVASKPQESVDDALDRFNS
ncbi:MAG: hypothetical protein CMI16_05695 [Opitutaceae bacterium]|nr:hypothetical protein [Opitutaceae bacterium]